MKIKLHYLADKPELIPICAAWAFSAWGKYNPAVTTQNRIESFQKHCNKKSAPLTIIAMDGNKAIGMASLRENDGIRQDLSPWLGSLYVHEDSRNQGLGEQLIREVNRKAAELGFKEIYLLTYEESLPNWYGSLGWQEIGKDVLAGNPVTVMKINLA